MSVITYSKGALRQILVDLKAAMDGNMFIDVRSGNRPSTPSAAATGTSGGLITVDGDGSTALTWDTLQTDGSGNHSLRKPLAVEWAVTAIASITAGYGRVYLAGDDPATVDTDWNNFRLDVPITEAGGLINLSPRTLVEDAKSIVNSAGMRFTTQQATL